MYNCKIYIIKYAAIGMQISIKSCHNINLEYNNKVDTCISGFDVFITAWKIPLIIVSPAEFAEYKLN